MTIGVMDAVKGAKELAELIKKYNDVPLYEKIVALQGQITDQASQLMQLISEHNELKELSALQTKTKFRNPYFYEEGNEVPLCPQCYSSSNKSLRIYLTHPSADYPAGHGRRCRNCKEFYKEGSRKHTASTVVSRSIASQARQYWE
jgi:hypothetical protein